MERGAVDRVDANRQSHDQCTRHQSARGTQSTEGAQKRRTVSFGHLKGALTRATMSPRRSTVFRPPTLISTENADDAQFPAIQGCLTHGRVKYNSARYENRETFGPAGAGSVDLGHRPDEFGRHIRPRAAAQLLREGDSSSPVAIDVFMPIK